MPKRDDIKSVLVIGSGPIVIGQACEFDYSGTQACRVLRDEGYRVVLVNSNPATIMTDPDFADRTYIEPLTPEVIARIIEREQPDAVLPTLGGQTGLNLAMDLYRQGLIGVPGTPASGEVARRRILGQPDPPVKRPSVPLSSGSSGTPSAMTIGERTRATRPPERSLGDGPRTPGLESAILRGALDPCVRRGSTRRAG